MNIIPLLTLSKSLQSHSRKDILDITIIHTNDIHSHYDPFDKNGSFCPEEERNSKHCIGGISRIKTLIKKERNKHQNLLVMDAGDQFQGTAFYSYFKYQVPLVVMNDIGYNITTIGNHEFDDGPYSLAKYYPQLTFPVVCSNLDLAKNAELARSVKPYHIFEEYNLAVIGYMTTETNTTSSPGKTVEFLDAIKEVQKNIDILHRKGIKRIIGLSHYGYLQDIDLISKTSGLSMVVGGHSHTYLPPSNNQTIGYYPTKVKDRKGKSVYVVTSGQWGQYVGRVKISIDSRGRIRKIKGKPIPVTNKIKENHRLKRKIYKFRKQFEEENNKIIGESKVDMPWDDCVLKECSLGNILTDSITSHFKDGLAITNSRAYRVGITKGILKVKDIINIFPFGNKIVKININGSDLKYVIEGVLSKTNWFTKNPVTSFMQISGFTFSYNSNNFPYNKVQSIHILKDGIPIPIDFKANYTLYTLDFVANGGDGILPVFDDVQLTDVQLVDVIIDYVELKSPLVEVIDHRMEDKI